MYLLSSWLCGQLLLILLHNAHCTQARYEISISYTSPLVRLRYAIDLDLRYVVILCPSRIQYTNYALTRHAERNALSKKTR